MCDRLAYSSSARNKSAASGQGIGVVSAKVVCTGARSGDTDTGRADGTTIAPSAGTNQTSLEQGGRLGSAECDEGSASDALVMLDLRLGNGKGLSGTATPVSISGLITDAFL